MQPGGYSIGTFSPGAGNGTPVAAGVVESDLVDEREGCPTAARRQKAIGIMKPDLR